MRSRSPQCAGMTVPHKAVTLPLIENRIPSQGTTVIRTSFDCSLGGQKSRKERIQHAAGWIHGPNRRGKLEPALPVSRSHVCLRYKRTLVQQRDAVSLRCEIIEFLKKGLPGRNVGRGMNGIDRKNFLILRV